MPPFSRPRHAQESLTVRIEPEVQEDLAAVAHAESRTLANVLSAMIRDWHETHPVATAQPRSRKAKKS